MVSAGDFRNGVTDVYKRQGVLTIFLDNRVRVVSSTEIRAKLRCGLPCHDLPNGVGEYIAAHGLYKGCLLYTSRCV